MKRLLLFTVLLSALFACSNSTKQQAESYEAFELDKFFAVADQKVDKNLMLIGYVTHVCMHSGQKCFIVGESQANSLRIEAKGEIKSFDSELVGSKISVTGVLKEGDKISRESINEMAEGVELRKASGEADEETCATELQNIEEMRKWMLANNKDHFVVYYLDGNSYQVLN